LILLLSLSVGACATTGATLGSGVGDRLLEHPPFYAGTAGPAGPEGVVRTGHLPVAYQRGASQAPIFDPSLSGPVQALLADMTGFLDSSGASIRLVEGGQVSAVTHAATRTPPDVQFGCVTEPGVPDDECGVPEGALGRGPQWMRLAVGRPSPEWVDWIGSVMADQGVDRALVVTLEVGQYPVHQHGWRGTKEVVLGTEHVASLPWLTSLETQVSVLQLTGAPIWITTLGGTSSPLSLATIRSTGIASYGLPGISPALLNSLPSRFVVSSSVPPRSSERS
jgi:hypothetical protein